MPWMEVGSQENQQWLAENRAAYTWEHFERDLALETWVDIQTARCVRVRFQELGFHPFDAKIPAVSIIIAAGSNSGLIALLDGIVQLSEVPRTGA